MADWTITTSPMTGTSGTTNFSITASSAESDDNLAIIKLCNTEKDVAGYVTVSQDDDKYNINYLDCIYSGSSSSTRITILNPIQSSAYPSGISQTNITGYSLDSGTTIIPVYNDSLTNRYYYFNSTAEAEGLHNIRLYLETGATSILSDNFKSTSLHSIVFPSFITRIEERAFAECDVAIADFSNHLKYIGDAAFSATQIEELFLPPSIDYVGNRAFAQTFNLNTATIYAKELGDGCFSYYLPEQHTSGWQSYVKKVYFGPTVKRIGKSAFMRCGNLKEIIFTEGLEDIDNEAFYRCYELTDNPYGLDCRVVLPYTIVHLGDGVFSESYLIKGFYIGKNSLCRTITPRKNFFVDNPNYEEGMQYFEYEIPTNIAHLKDSLFDYPPLSFANVPEVISNMYEGVKVKEGGIYNYSDSSLTLCFINSTCICETVVPDYFTCNQNGYSKLPANLVYSIIFNQTTLSIGHYAFRLNNDSTVLPYYITYPNLIFAYPTTAPSIESDSFLGSVSNVNLELHYPTNSDYSSWITYFENKGFTVTAVADL